MKKNNFITMIYAAMLAALTCIATMVIKVPTLGTNGYVNIGDTIVLFAAWTLGNPYGALAAGIGSGLADLLAGCGSYVPGTTVIKFVMAFVACIVFKGLNKVNSPKPVAYIAGGVAAETVMVVGYFVYEATLLGYGMAAAASIISNMIQGITCLVFGVVLTIAVKKMPAFNAMLVKAR